ncbi:sensor histidine kinase [Metabacillus sp. HB246100]
MTILILIVLSSFNLYTTYTNTKKTIELTMANQARFSADEILLNFDVAVLESYLNSPTSVEKRNLLERELRDAKRLSRGSYASILTKNSEGIPRRIAGGKAEGRLHQADDCCLLSEKFLEQYSEDKPFTSRIETDDHVTFIASGVPIINNEGVPLGAIVVEIGVGKVTDITNEVMKNNVSFFIFSTLFVLFSFIIFVVFQLWFRREVTSRVGDAEETYQVEFQSMLHTMRSIRHDFINHIQVIQGLLKIGREDRAFEYVNSLTKEVDSMELPLKIKNPALFILLQSKWVRAQNDKVDMHLLIDDHQFSRLSSIDLIKIFSNLIDNAFDATLQFQEVDRFISVEATVASNQYIFKVENIGPTISPDMMNDIFQAGFSTKVERSGVPRGDGLGIVKNVVAKYNGKISVESKKNTTSFTVTIPIKNER